VSIFARAISWDAENLVLIMFAFFAPNRGSTVPPLHADPGPVELRKYYLEDPDQRFGDIGCYEYDLYMGKVRGVVDELPEHTETMIAAWIAAALDAGAELVWFGFEGSFSFENILDPEIADLLYAVADESGQVFALDDNYREGKDWPEVLVSFRERFEAKIFD
jgi:hypothetical protein